MPTPEISFDPADYTYEWYDDLLSSLIESGYEFRGFDGADPASGEVFLRHDVDWSPHAAVRMAEFEAMHDVTGTYFFLFTSPFYNLFTAEHRQCVRRIEELGHEVGLHLAVGEVWDEEPEDAELCALVEEYRSMIEMVADDPTEAIAFHNPPDWTLNRVYDTFSSTYEPRLFDEIGYESDSLHKWRTEPPFADGVPETVQILLHPTLWGEQDRPPEAHIRQRQQRFLEQTNGHMRAASRLEWPYESNIGPD